MHMNLAIFIWNFCRLSLHFNLHIFARNFYWGTYIDALWMFKISFFSSDWNTPFEFVSIFVPKMHHIFLPVFVVLTRLFPTCTHQDLNCRHWSGKCDVTKHRYFVSLADKSLEVTYDRLRHEKKLPQARMTKVDRDWQKKQSTRISCEVSVIL